MGSIDFETPLPPIEIPLQVFEVIPNSGSILGGYEVTLLGSGFLNDKAEVAVIMCGSEARVESSSPTRVVIEMPSC